MNSRAFSQLRLGVTAEVLGRLHFLVFAVLILTAAARVLAVAGSS